MSTREKVVRKPGVVEKDLGEETILYDASSRVVHVLNPTAKLIWDLCDGKHTVDEMAVAIRERFAVGAERDVPADIRQTLETFVEKGLV